MKKCDICLLENECLGVDDPIAQENCGFTCLDCVYADSHTEIYGCELCPLDEE